MRKKKISCYKSCSQSKEDIWALRHCRQKSGQGLRGGNLLIFTFKSSPSITLCLTRPLKWSWDNLQLPGYLRTSSKQFNDKSSLTPARAVQSRAAVGTPLYDAVSTVAWINASLLGKGITCLETTRPPVARQGAGAADGLRHRRGAGRAVPGGRAAPRLRSAGAPPALVRDSRGRR